MIVYLKENRLLKSLYVPITGRVIYTGESVHLPDADLDQVKESLSNNKAIKSALATMKVELEDVVAFTLDAKTPTLEVDPPGEDLPEDDLSEDGAPKVPVKSVKKRG